MIYNSSSHRSNLFKEDFMAQDDAMPQRTVRTEFNHNYEWNEALGFWYNRAVRLGENPVQIFPPSGTRTDWYVVVPRTGGFHNLRGDVVEERCFAIAAGFITQNQKPA